MPRRLALAAVLVRREVDVLQIILRFATFGDRRGQVAVLRGLRRRLLAEALGLVLAMEPNALLVVIYSLVPLGIN